MEGISEITAQWPLLGVVLGALAILVGLFQKSVAANTDKFVSFLNSQNERLDEKDEASANLIKGLSESCHAVQRETASRMIAALDKNTDMMGRTTAALEWHERNRQQNPQRPTTERQV